MLNYFLGPWVWDESDPNAPFYRAPTGTIGLVDLRPVAPTLSMGFFATNVALGSDYESFGDGVNRLEDIALTPQQRSLWSSALGIGAISGNRLIDALWETLTLHSDPDGGAVCRPLMPTHKGILELHLGGHSLIRSDRFTGVDHPAWPKIQALVQRNYRGVRGQGQSDAGMYRSLRESPEPQRNSPQYVFWKSVDAMKRRLGIDFNTARDAKAAESEIIHSKYLECMRRKLRCPWEDLIPGDLPQEPPRRPDTTLNESWPTDSTTISSGQDLTWAEVSGDLTVSSGRISAVSGERRRGRAESDLSSDDHYAQQVIYGLTADSITDQSGALTRYAAAADTCYVANGRRGDLVYLRKYVTGTLTQLAVTDLGANTSLPDGTVIKNESNGSTIRSLVDDVQIDSVTDTSITGNTRCGTMVGTNGQGDAWEAADLVAAAGNAFPFAGPFAGPFSGPFG